MVRLDCFAKVSEGEQNRAGREALVLLSAQKSGSSLTVWHACTIPDGKPVALFGARLPQKLTLRAGFCSETHHRHDAISAMAA